VKKMTVTSSLAGILEGKFSVMASDMKAEEWIKCRHTARFPTTHTMTLDINCPTSGTIIPAGGVVSNVKIVFDQALDKPLEVCGMDVGGMVL
jgi:hypothetical protein